jgi:predicted AAA+ superfamily ATPase
VLAQAIESRVSHLRLNSGEREVDLILEGPEGQIIGIEVKLAPDVTDSDVRHLKWLREQLPDRVVDLVVVTTGTTAYRRSDGVAVVPLALLGL